ncbi:MAG: sun protein [Acidobacteria bacterium]|nr:sun protein [Acidobacteriota bacterium]
MISPARKLAYRFLSQIEARQIFSDDALHSDAMKRLAIRDRHLTTEVVYGTLRWQELLDHMSNGASSRPLHEVEPGARILLRMSVYQMWQMDRIPDHALVNDAVELAKRELGKGIDRYLNGVLRNLARTRPWKRKEFLKDAPPWVRLSLPKWLWERWASRFGEAAAADFAASLNHPPQAAFRLGNEHGSAAAAIRSDLVPGAGIRPVSASDEGRRLEYQDEASQLMPHLLGAISNWRVWDACAAPGGKSAILSSLVGRSGRVVSSDAREERLARMAALAKVSASRNRDLLVADASEAAPFRCSFDAVLADVPCSGLGTLRRNPEIKWHFKPESLLSLQEMQKRIVCAVSQTVRPGGRLLYSTCSTEPEEDEEVIQSFLRAHRDFRLLPPDSPPGIERWTGSDGMVRTFPSTRLWDGFFAALMIRFEH